MTFTGKTTSSALQKFLAATSLAALAGSLAACSNAPPPQKTPLPVHAVVVQPTTVGNPARYSASIVPYAQVDLAFQSSGYLESIRQVKSAGGGMRNIDQGDWVPRGTVLATVRQSDYSDKVSQAKAQLSRSQAEFTKAKLTFDRTAALYSSQSATKPDYDSAKAQLDSTAASVSGAEAQVSEAGTALAYCQLRAPFDGWIVKRSVDLGSFVGPATNGFTLANTRSVKAVFGVPDTAIGRVKIGQRIDIATDALSKSFPGQITAISPAADPKSRVFSVEVTINNPKNELKSGMIASLALDGQTLPQSVLAVPLSAVIRDPNHNDAFAVMIAAGDGDLETVRLRAVTVGDIYGNLISITSGLQAGDKVITTGSTLIQSGDRVRVIP